MFLTLGCLPREFTIIETWTKETEDGRVVYDIELKECGRKAEMEVSEIKDRKEVHGGFEIVLVTADNMDVEVTIAKDGKILEDSTDKKDEKKK